MYPQFQKQKKNCWSVSQYLVCLIEEQTEVGEDHPQFLPAITVLKLPQQVARQLVLQRWRSQHLRDVTAQTGPPC